MSETHKERSSQETEREIEGKLVHTADVYKKVLLCMDISFYS